MSRRRSVVGHTYHCEQCGRLLGVTVTEVESGTTHRIAHRPSVRIDDKVRCYGCWGEASGYDRSRLANP